MKTITLVIKKMTLLMENNGNYVNNNSTYKTMDLKSRSPIHMNNISTRPRSHSAPGQVLPLRSKPRFSADKRTR